MRKLWLKNPLYPFPPLMDDEDLYSGLTRLFAFCPINNASTFGRTVLNKTHVNPVLPQVLDAFTDPKAAMEATVYPQMLSCLTKKSQEKATQRILKGLHVGKTLGLNNFKGIQKREGLKWCPVCFKADLNEFGFPTYKSIHQIAGIEYCPEHGILLQDAPKGEYPLLTAKALPEPPSCSPAVRRMLLLVKDFKGITKEQLAGVVKQRFVQEKLVNPADPVLRLDRRELFYRLENRYGTSYLSSLGVSYDSDSRWTRHLLTKKGTVPVVLNLMVMDVLDITPAEVRAYKPDGTEFDTAPVIRHNRQESVENSRAMYRKRCGLADKAGLEKLETAWPQLKDGQKILTKSFLTQVAGFENYNTLNRYYPLSAAFISSHSETYDEGLRRVGKLLIKEYLKERPERKLSYHVLSRLGYHEKSKRIFKELVEEMGITEILSEREI